MQKTISSQISSFFSLSQVFLCEVASPSRRGLAAAMYAVLHSFGFCMMLLLGAVLHWRVAMAVPVILSLPTMAALANLKESPAWLQRQGRNQEAQEAADFYRISLPVSAPISKESIFQDAKEKSLLERLKGILHTLTLQGSAFWCNFAFLASLFLLLGWCGFSILSFYAVEVFQLSGSPISAAHTSWITRYKIQGIPHQFIFFLLQSHKNLLCHLLLLLPSQVQQVRVCLSNTL